MAYNNSRDSDLVNIIRREIEDSEYNVYEFQDQHTAIDYYFGKPNGTEIEGRSQVVSRDVADMLEATVAAIAPSFESDNLVEVSPCGEYDEKQANIEGQFINYAMMNWNNGYLQIQQALRDALLFRNCVAKVYKDVKIKTETLQFDQPIDEFVILNIQQGLQPNQSIHVQDELMIHIQTETSKLMFETIPIEEFIFTPAWNENTLENCPFTAHHRLVTRQELIQMGFDYDEILEIPKTDGLTGTTGNEDTASLRQQEPYEQASQTISERINFYECYLYLDFEGYVQMYQVNYAENRIIGEPIPVNYHPFAGGTCILMPHRWVGISLYDQLSDIQDIKTFGLRQYLDNLNHNNNRRMEVEMPKIYDINDVLESRPAGVVKVKQRGAVNPIPVDDIGPSIQSLLNYMDKIRTERSGASLDMQTENMQVGENRTAHGAERLVSSKEMIAAALTRVFSETFVKSAAHLCQQVLANEFNEEMTAKIGGEWQVTNPAVTWIKERSVNLNVLPSIGERNKKSGALSAIIQQQTLAIDKGEFGSLVNRSNVHAALIDFANSSGVDFPDKYWMDPQSEQAQQAIQMKNQQQQQQTADQKKMMDTMTQNEILKTKITEQSAQAKTMIESLRVQIEQAKAGIEAAENNAQLQFDYEQLYLNLGMQLTSLEAQYNKEIEDYQENKEQVH